MTSKNKPVYNLAVSGYGTPRELIRLEKSNLIDKVDTIIIQYCYNDYGENKDFRINEEDVAKQKAFRFTFSSLKGITL